MAWDTSTKQGLIIDLARNYFDGMDDRQRDDLARMSPDLIARERLSTLDVVTRHQSYGEVAKSDLKKLRLLEFLEFCHTQTLDPEPENDLAQKHMHRKLKLATEGKTTFGTSRDSLIHENRLKSRTQALNNRTKPGLHTTTVS